MDYRMKPFGITATADFVKYPLSADHKKERLTGVDWLLALILLTVVFGIYHSVLSASFISFDDSVYVYDNPVIRNGFTSQGFRKIMSFRQDAGPYWHPVTSLSHMADCQFFGLDPGLHHLSNLIIHGLNVMLLFLFFRISTGRVTESFFLALVFAVHPLNVETVAWVSERKNLLVAFFFILGLHAWRFHVMYRNGRSYLFLWLVFFLGIMSKPVMMTFPFALFLVHHFPLNACDHSRESVKGFLIRNARDVKPLFQMILAMLVMFFAGFSLSGSTETVAPLNHVSFTLRLSTMAVNYLVYLKALVLPFDLTVFRPYPPSVAFGATIVSLVFVAAVSVFAFRMFRRLPWLFFGWFWYLGNLVTASGLVQKGYWPAWADRFAYLPMVGILVVLIWGLSDMLNFLKSKKTVLWVAGTAAVVFFASLSLAQVRHWKNAETLFRHAVAVNPNDVLSLTSLALALGEQGRLDEAITVSEKALAIEPSYAEALNNLGTLLAKKGDIAQGLTYFQKSLEAYPGFEKALENEARARKLLETVPPVKEPEPETPAVEEKPAVDVNKTTGESPTTAELNLRRNLQDTPDNLDAAGELALILVSEKRYTEAEKLYLGMLLSHPDAKVSVFYNLACLYAIMGLPDKAMGFLENSVRSGFTSWDHMEKDRDLESLRKRADFKALLAAGKKGAKS